MKDDELLERFEAGTLDKLPHEDHVRVAYLLTRQYEVDEAADRMMSGLRGLASRFGTSPAFLDVTRTVAWTRLIDGLDGSGSSTEFLEAHPELHRRDLLDDYYSGVRLRNPVAHFRFVKPDRRGFPDQRSRGVR